MVTSTDKRTKETKRNSDTQIPHSHKCNSIIKEPIYATASLMIKELLSHNHKFIINSLKKNTASHARLSFL